MNELVSMEDAIRAADFQRDKAEKIGEVEAQRYHLEDFRKVQFSVLWEKAPDGSIASKDALHSSLELANSKLPPLPTF